MAFCFFTFAKAAVDDDIGTLAEDITKGSLAEYAVDDDIVTLAEAAVDDDTGTPAEDVTKGTLGEGAVDDETMFFWPLAERVERDEGSTTKGAFTANKPLAEGAEVKVPAMFTASTASAASVPLAGDVEAPFISRECFSTTRRSC